MAGVIKYWKSKVMLVKAEVTAGTDSVPTGALDAIKVSDLTISVNADEVSSTVDGASFQNDEIDFTNKTFTISGGINMYASGTAGTAPDYAPLLIACQMEETVVAATSVTYTPVTGSTESASVYLEIDGILYKCLYTKGNATFTTGIGEFDRFDFELTGVYLEPTDDTIAGATYNIQPTFVGTEARCELSVHGTLVDGVSFNMSSGNSINVKESTETYAIVNDDRKATASMSMWSDLLATFNPFAINEAKTRDAVYWQSGTTAGSILRFDLPKAMLKLPQPTDIDGLSGYDVELVPYPDSGDDEFSITFE